MNDANAFVVCIGRDLAALPALHRTVTGAMQEPVDLTRARTPRTMRCGSNLSQTRPCGGPDAGADLRARGKKTAASPRSCGRDRNARPGAMAWASGEAMDARNAPPVASPMIDRASTKWPPPTGSGGGNACCRAASPADVSTSGRDETPTGRRRLLRNLQIFLKSVSRRRPGGCIARPCRPRADGHAGARGPISPIAMSTRAEVAHRG